MSKSLPEITSDRLFYSQQLFQNFENERGTGGAETTHLQLFSVFLLAGTGFVTVGNYDFMLGIFFPVGKASLVNAHLVIILFGQCVTN